uniref:Uncharacterized protein n=1 Tax=Romanomermis culicivorax TaxID=13658 RepID=A0A915KKG7_ROMCU
MSGDAGTNDEANSKSSRRRMKILFEKSADALSLTRYKNFPLPGDVTMGDEYRRLIVSPESCYALRNLLLNLDQSSQLSKF